MNRIVLFVDDDRDFTSLVSDYLESEIGCTVIKAFDGNEALEKWQEFKPSVIVLDIMLPKRSGFLVAEKIKRESSGNHQPAIIVVTALAGSRHEQYALSIGVQKYMRKPFKLEELAIEVKQALAK